MEYVKTKKTVIFCASVNHANEIADLLRKNQIAAESVSGRDDVNVRNKILHNYEHGNINVLCACDLLTEGWDSPRTEVLFMARPTLSKTTYMQQLGRGMRKCEGKTDLIVFDFVDNANLFNMAYSLHRILNISEYHPLEYVLSSDDQRKCDENLFFKGEKPSAYIDIPISVDDFESIDLFNWQNASREMISQIEFVRMVDVQAETIDRYVKDGKIKPDMAVPVGDNRFFNYFHEESVRLYAKQFKWDLITDANIKDKFMDFVTAMDMSFSYKPVLLKAIFDGVDENGVVRLCDIADYFTAFYENRLQNGLLAEKTSSIYQKGGYTQKDVVNNILANPFKRFADMRFLRRSKNIENIEFNPVIFKKLTSSDRKRILDICDLKLDEYYGRI